MAVQLLAASSQYLTQADPPVVAYPFAVGCYYKLRAAANSTRAVFSLADTATTTNYLQLRMATTEIMRNIAEDGTGENAGAASTALVAGVWNFTLVRFVSATFRRFRPLYGNGFSGEVGNSSTSRSPTGMDTIALGALVTSGGASQFWDGDIAEYFVLKDDPIIHTAADHTSAFTRSLAWGGPFSIPQVARLVVEYRSFRTSINGGGPDDIYCGSMGSPREWVNNNAATISPHPHQSSNWVKPSQWRKTLVV